MVFKKLLNYLEKLFVRWIYPSKNNHVTKSYNNSHVTKSYNNGRTNSSHNIKYVTNYLADHRTFIFSTWNHLSEIVAQNWIILSIILISLLLLCFIIQSQWLQYYSSAEKKKCLSCKNPIENRNLKIDDDNVENTKSATLPEFIIKFQKDIK